MNPSVNPLSNYDARTFTLQANVPVALPPARDYVLLSASVNVAVVGLTVSDNNGDAGLWPIGIKVRLNKRMPARLSSAVAQSVTVLMVDGDVEVEDSRSVDQQFPYGARADALSVNIGFSVPTATLQTVLSGAANVRGAIVSAFDFTLCSTIASACDGTMVINGLNFIGGRVEAGAILAVRYTLSQPVYIDAGLSLGFNNILSPANIAIRGSYRLL